MADFDIAIVGGGINGAGLARDAAGRGLRVLLVEMNDLASGTSSASSKLIHGGLRYLEHGALRLVREALTEREVLLRMAPHVIRPMRFMLPPLPGRRAPLKLRLGLFLYDWLGARKLLPASHTVDLTHHMVGQPLQRQFRYGFEYSDCWVDDSRLVLLTARDAADRGAVIRTHTKLTRAERGEMWELVLNNRGRRDTARARVLVNAAGPWIGEVAENIVRMPLKKAVRLIKGSHIVVRRRFEHDTGYILQAADGRVVFALPFAQDFTLIGTTDENFVGDLNAPAPDAKEILYLCDVMNQYFRDRVTPDELVWSFAGVRALYDDGAGKLEDVTRDYELVLDERSGSAPLLTIYGGKITTYRKLAEAAMGKIGPFFATRPAWTAGSALPGGEFKPEDFYNVVAETISRWPFLSEPHARRLIRAYGLRVAQILGDARSMDDLGERFTDDLTGAELRYLVENEWAETAEDVLWRRTKLGLKATPDERIAINQFIVSLSASLPSPR
ncbi:MAG TPA: glycerol-3-phosphate dehydrogenase [Pseudolabrys sp.]|jgi:glycerol-3-phosphate dehydrogenase|nr:glycerol-3-phosphate dehydrogenase [Pseudolabrys sp.]